MKYIDTEGKGHTLLILTDAESRQVRHVFAEILKVGSGLPLSDVKQAQDAFNRGIQRGTDKMTEESKAEWKERAKK